MEITRTTLELFYKDFVEFIKQQTGKDFKSFKTSKYIDEQENYKYEVFEKANQALRYVDWNTEDIGKGLIQTYVNAAIQVKPSRHKNNLLDWRKKDEFAKLPVDKYLEEMLYGLYKNTVTERDVFEKLFAKRIPYQTIAYMFFY